MTDEVLFCVSENGVATITLNRPKALNSLTYDMLIAIGDKLKEWAADDHIQVVVMKGAGTKGFCAGGDIKSLYEAASSQDAMHQAEHFFEVEYQVDQMIYTYEKPIIACLDGIVMGGGVGLTYGARHKIVTERTKWAMPEMNIGFFPDVGAAYFLNKAPGHIGRYLAMTATVIQAQDVIYIHGADVYMTSESMQSFLAHLEQVEWELNNADATLNQLLHEHSEKPAQESELPLLQKQIDHYFSFEKVEEIICACEKDQSDFARTTKETLLSKSPASLKITLKQLTEGKLKSLSDCFATDLVLANNFLRHRDFFEGVRSVLIDKDQEPLYMYRSLADVSEEMVESFFERSIKK
ncbi:enoyl-CoA hydratase/isomerase family protein [Brevibacillus fortis]|uniref:3-hydroxyisobutyryl-CoA hydrolase n=1 Tax=Brevibacillus fortis TaxID=2126352 RepID=A0A2P7V8I4_9BACL|nr:enoyl-CoA hydratase/isomerase family protein [Brevibacillus fortis]PSJ95524.1 3-hydroxyisobutyryl-CoA hydrolase [Brevibacillus fortis]